MKKIIIILVAVLLFCQCSTMKEESSTMKEENGFCECIRKETGNEEIGNDENVFLKGELIITEGSCFPEVADKYLYIINGHEPWWNEENPWYANQLPDDVLKSISTMGLIRSFIDMPGFYQDVTIVKLILI